MLCVFFREIKDVAECLVYFSFNKRMAKLYQKQSKEERKAIVDNLIEVLELVQRQEATGLKSTSLVRKNEKKRLQKMLGCFEKYPIDGMNQEQIEKLKSSMHSHIMDDKYTWPKSQDYTQDLLKIIAGNLAKKQGEKYGGKAAKWITEKAVDGIFSLL